MSSASVDLVIEKGATFKKTFYLKDSNKVAINLSGYTARMHIRSSPSSSTIIVNLTTENGGIIITDVEGKIELYITDEDTSALTYKGSGVYDIELEDITGEVLKLVRGTVSFIEEITR